MLHLGVNNPNVNLKFEKLFLGSEKLATQLTFTCSKSTTETLEKGVKYFQSWTLTCSLNRLLGRADYHNFTNVTSAVAEYTLNHSITCWITLWGVLVRLVEQYDNLKHYFLTFMPTIWSLKSSVEKALHYIKICSALEDESTLQYLSFVTYFAIDFKLFLRKFHSMNPLVHILYDEMRDCYRIFCRSLSNQSI